MKHLLIGLVFSLMAAAQTAPQAVAVVISPDMAAFATMTPKPDFPAEWIVKVKVASVNDVFRISITCVDAAVKIPPALVAWQETGWQGISGSLPAGCKVANGGITLSLLTAGTASPVPTAQ